jgi:hypothetical protein
MQENKHREMCDYCSKWFLARNMVSLHEQGTTFILYYCMSCYDEVKSNIASLPWSHLYTFKLQN